MIWMQNLRQRKDKELTAAWLSLTGQVAALSYVNVPGHGLHRVARVDACHDWPMTAAHYSKPDVP